MVNINLDHFYNLIGRKDMLILQLQMEIEELKSRLIPPDLKEVKMPLTAKKVKEKSNG